MPSSSPPIRRRTARARCRRCGGGGSRRGAGPPPRGAPPRGVVCGGGWPPPPPPPYYPPWSVGDERYLDGGVLANLPLEIAMAHGASEAVVLDLHDAAARPATTSMRDTGLAEIA